VGEESVLIALEKNFAASSVSYYSCWLLVASSSKPTSN